MTSAIVSVTEMRGSKGKGESVTGSFDAVALGDIAMITLIVVAGSVFWMTDHHTV